MNPLHSLSSSAVKPATRSLSHKLINALHRYLGLLAFGQVLLWSLSGALMYTLDFADLYADPPPRALPLAQATLTPQGLQKRLQTLIPGSQLTGLRVQNLGGELTYLLERSQGAPMLLDARGQRLDPIPAGLAAKVAQAGYTGQGKLSGSELLPASHGNYASSRPIYRIRFADAQQTEIYVDPGTGALLARRKALWGLYNRMWEFHLMKYTPWSGFNKLLLLVFAVLNGLVALTGFVKFFRWGYAMRSKPEPASPPS